MDDMNRTLEQWLNRQPIQDRLAYRRDRVALLTEIQRQVAVQLALLVAPHVELITPEQDNIVVLSVGAQQLKPKDMRELRRNFKEAAGADIASKVVIVAMDKMVSV